MKKLFISLLFSICAVSAVAQSDENCFGIIAGRAATVDGTVLMGHNEDDSGEQMLNIYVVKSDSKQETAKYIWAEFPKMEQADAFMNEYGVCVASDGCSSRESVDDFTDGGILYDVRVNVAKYATSARHAAELIGEMVEKYGYRGSGRTYVVADPTQGWIVSVVKGRHWVAQRVPDDKVMLIPNYYVIDKVDLSDKDNFLGSADLIDYAIEKGWYDPVKDGEFSFRNAYASPKTIASTNNIDRHKLALNYICGGEYDYSWETMEAMVTPARKVDMKDLKAVLSGHAEDNEDGTHPGLICNNSTILCTIFQLRNDLPREVGCIMWAAAGRPCAEAFIPWYLGMSASPAGWQRFKTPAEAYEKHLTDTENMRLNYPEGNYWKCVDHWDAIDGSYAVNIDKRQKEIEKFQNKIEKKQVSFEKKLLKKNSQKRWARLMNRYTAKWYKKYFKTF
jgi:Dipeptidase